jgi:hypothetical protein
MTFDDLAMINIQARSDGTWSWTAYRTGHVMWRSNTDEDSPLDCILGIIAEIDATNKLRARLDPVFSEPMTGQSPRCAETSGGIGEQKRCDGPAPKAKSQTTKVRIPKRAKTARTS